MKNEVLFMLSPAGGVGKSFITSALAISLSLQSRRNVLIVDAYNGFSTLDYLFETDSDNIMDAGDFFSHRCSMDKIMHKTSVENVDFVPFSSDLTAKTNCADFAEMLNFMSELYDYVIVDTPSVEFASRVAKHTDNKRAIITAQHKPAMLIDCPQISEIMFDANVSDVQIILNCFIKKIFLESESFYDIDELIDTVQASLLGIVPYDPNVYFSSFDKPNVQQLINSISESNIKNKKSAFSAINRISLRMEGNKNAFINF